MDWRNELQAASSFCAQPSVDWAVDVTTQERVVP